jgi:hypothetical protein
MGFSRPPTSLKLEGFLGPSYFRAQPRSRKTEAWVDSTAEVVSFLSLLPPVRLSFTLFSNNTFCYLFHEILQVNYRQ